MAMMTRRERQVTDPEKILEILQRSKVVHLGLCDGNQPYVVPMNYGYEMQEGRLTLYLHGAPQGRKYDVMARQPRVSFTMECDLQPFTGKVACMYGLSYSCLMGEGTASFVEDPAEKCRALSLIMKAQTGKISLLMKSWHRWYALYALMWKATRRSTGRYPSGKGPPKGSRGRPESPWSPPQRRNPLRYGEG